MPAEGDILLRRVFPVPADAIDQAGQVSTEVRRLLRGLGVEPEVVRRAGIVCFEGEMNIALYTKGGGLCWWCGRIGWSSCFPTGGRDGHPQHGAELGRPGDQVPGGGGHRDPGHHPEEER